MASETEEQELEDAEAEFSEDKPEEAENNMRILTVCEYLLHSDSHPTTTIRIQKAMMKQTLASG
jgi:hypothetical protein